MKLRIFGDSLRFRLTQKEVAQLATGESLESVTRLTPECVFRCLIEPETDESAPSAWLDHGSLLVEWPGAALRQWADAADQVSLEAVQANGEGELRLLIEKDFTCLAPREGAEDADTFPNPNTAS